MNFGFVFFFESILLGAGLAMDAFSVSLANGLNEPRMKVRKMCIMAAIFAFFQALMPMIGWICVHTVVQYFHAFEKLIPWIALGLLGFIGGKMLYESLTNKCEECDACAVGLTALLVQGVATSIDALSVGFTIADHNLPEALVAAAVIALVTFIICVIGVYIGTRAGTKLAGKAGILGGSILIFIGLWIFIKSWL
ncbi:MAG: manganese efflux pump [Clostridia bacterium]|nr:manganese efflux pump [Clostridia bacterium]